MSSSPLSQEKSFLLVLKKLWRRDGERVDLDICDLAVVEADQSVSRWLFTSREGQVRSKRRENCTSARRLVEHAQRVEELLCGGTGGERDREKERESRSLALRSWFAPCAAPAESKRGTDGGLCPALRWQALSLPQGARSLVVLPSAQTQTAGETRLLKATFQRDPRNLYALPKLKCFLPSLSPLPQRDRERDRDRDRERAAQWPQSFVECRNAFTASIVQTFVAKLVKLIDSQSSSAVLSLTLFVLLCEEERDAHVPLQSPDRFRVWLHHVESLQFAVKETSAAPSSSVSASASSLVRRLDSSSELLSQASVLKPWALCDGDFCFFSRSAADENGEFDSVLDEARRAIRRHRSTEEDALSAMETAMDNENDNDNDNDENNENDDFIGAERDTQRDTEMAQSTQPPKLPTKALRITNKWILRAREEMEQLAQLDQRLAELSLTDNERQRVKDSEEALAVRAQIAELWPASVSRWWLSDSERQRVRPRLRERERETEREKERYRQAIEREGVAENESEGGKNKWFSVNYSQSTVCENCFFVYELLEKHRKARERREARVSKEAKETDAQRRKRDQDIERRMFEQRRLATRLSKCKSAPAVVQNDRSAASLAQKLPPLHWKATTRYNTQREDSIDALMSKRSVAQHLMQRPVLLPIERAGVAEDATAREWAALVARQEEREKAKAQLPPLRRPKEVEKPTVDVTNYTAQHLLHPWQRELHKLREQAMNDGGGKSIFSHESSDKQQPGEKFRSPVKLASIAQIGTTMSAEEEEEDGEFGELGWSPFVI